MWSLAHAGYKHMLDGDGYICRFAFDDDGRVSFRSRFVRTKEFKVGAVQARPCLESATPVSSKFDCAKGCDGAFNLNLVFLLSLLATMSRRRRRH